MTLNKFLIAFALLFLQPGVYAQKTKDFPDFGKVTAAELEMKDCEFDKNADAVVLFDVAESNCILNLYSSFNPVNYSIECHVRIKILKASGAKNADVHIPYWPYNEERIKNLSAQTYNLDAAGNIVISKVEKSQVYDKKISKRKSEIVFTFPEVKAGSVIEYKYIDDGVSTRKWFFQKKIPVVESRFIVDFPNEIIVSAIPYCTLPLSYQKEQRSSRTIYRYAMTNIPALPDEPYMSCREDYLQRVETKLVAVDFSGQPRRGLVTSWPKVIKSLLEDDDFGTQLKRNIPRTDDLEAMLRNVTDPFKKMAIIHNYVRKNMEWNGYDNLWALDGVRSAWKDKKGTSGEINLILINLLKDADLNAHAILVSTRANGAVSTFDPGTIINPGYNQFDKVMAYVTIGDNFYVLDATEKFTPSKLIPLEVMATEGMLIEKPESFDWGWKTLWNDKQLFLTTVLLSGNIDDKGAMTGDAAISLDGYERVEHIEDFKKDKEKYIQNYFTEKNDGVKIEGFKSENTDIDSLPLNHSFNYSQQLNASGDYIYFSTNLFTGLEKNPFIANTRFSDIAFGANQKYSIIANFYIPENYVFDAVPQSVKMIMPDTSINFTRIIGASNETGLVSMRITIEFKSPVFGVNSYPEFQEFYKKMYGMLNEQIVIKKKN